MLVIVGQVIFLASAWFLPFASEYSLIGDNISELALGRYGFVQTAAFVISGLTTLGLAFAIRQLTVGLRGSIIGALMVAVYGAGALLSAIFPTDRIDSAADIAALSATGIVHAAGAVISFLCIIVGMFVLAWTFRRAARWRTLTPWSVLVAGGALALLFVQAEGPWVGLMQRLLLSVIATWLILVATRVRSIAASGGTDAFAR